LENGFSLSVNGGLHRPYHRYDDNARKDNLVILEFSSQQHRALALGALSVFHCGEILYPTDPGSALADIKRMANEFA
jgi:hypothetical protein